MFLCRDMPLAPSRNQPPAALGRQHPTQAAALQRGAREQAEMGGKCLARTVCGLIPNIRFINKA